MLVARWARSSGPFAIRSRVRPGWIGGALLVLSGLTFAAALGEYLVSSEATIWLANAGWTAAAAAAVLGVAAAMVSSAPDDRPGWTVFLAATVAWLVGQVFWDVYAATSFPASPNPADLCWLGFAVAGAAGMHRLYRGRWRLAAFSVLELVPLIVAVSALVFALLKSDIAASQISGLGQATAVAYPILYVSAVVVVIQALLAGALHWRRHRGLVLVIGGMMLNGAGFILWSSQLLSNTYTVGTNAVDGLWSVGMILIGVGAWAERTSLPILGDEPVTRRRSGVLPALTFVVLAGVLIAANADNGGSGLILSLGVAVIGVTLIAHAAVLRRSQDRLLIRLQSSERELREVNRRLAEESRRDALTGLANRLRLDEDLADLAAMAERSRQPFCFVLLDLDRFKAYNDTEGHLAGDRALRRVASLLDQNVRGGERAYRYGGEEFVIILRDQDLKAGHALAERCRAELYDRAIAHPLNPTHNVVTFTAGVAASQCGETPEQVLHRADLALYQAKAQGRNQIGAPKPAQPARTTVTGTDKHLHAEQDHAPALRRPSAQPQRPTNSLRRPTAGGRGR